MFSYLKSNKLFSCVCSVLAFGLLLNTYGLAYRALQSTDWGLSYKQEGSTPEGPVSAEELKTYNAYYADSPNEKVIYLTFDAGYEAGYTPAILDALKKHNVCATFFVVGHYIDENPDLIKRMVEEGHIVGNHTNKHPNMAKLSDPQAFSQELKALEEKYKSVTGQEMQKFYRPPEGKFSMENLKAANDLGYKTIFWSLAYADWDKTKQPSHDQAFSKLIPRIHPGAIVLLHNTSKTNGEILDELLTRWEQEGYTFKNLQELS